MFFGISIFILLIFIVIFSTTSVDDLTSFMRVNGEAPPDLLSEIAKGIRLLIVAPLFGFGLFLSIFSASSFIPHMLEKGSIDLLLSKPVSRAQIIIGKFLGGFLVVLINIAFLVGGIWILIGLKLGIWNAEILLTILTISFTFAVLYSLIIFIGIISQSSILAMMITYLIFIVLSPLLQARDQLSILFKSKFVESFMDILYYITPKTTELGGITNNLAVGGGIDDYQPILSSLVFMILILALSIITFSKKDY